MIGVDTNVIARLFLDDDPKQQESARRFFARRTATDPAFISAVVLAEFVWLLTLRYGYARDAVHTALSAIFVSANVAVEREDLVKSAVATARDRNADVADAIIGAIAAQHDCASTVTFDREAAKRVPGMELLK
jgi:predicted nucleic-acid-binding protein